MKIVEKPLIVSGSQLGTFQAYTDIEPELNATEKGIRVLPAPFFYEKRLYFTLIRRWEPGENRIFPGGGFEVRDEGHATRNYELDQVIIHPAVLKHKKTLDKMARKAEKATTKRLLQGERATKKMAKESGGKRGRRPLSDEEKAARLLVKGEQAVRSGGKRGRPKGINSAPKAPKISTGKRGRPSLSAEVIALKAQDKAAKTAISGGKRGRPKKLI